MTIYRGQVWMRVGVALAAVSCAALVSLSAQAAMAQEGGDTSDFIDRALPNPTGEMILNWAPLPDNRVWGSTAGIDIGPDGHVWAYDRCGGLALAGGCEENPELDPVFKFNKDTGAVMTSFGAGLFVLPHGIHVDNDGNVWIGPSWPEFELPGKVVSSVEAPSSLKPISTGPG